MLSFFSGQAMDDARRRRDAGFTLIELLVVIVILGVLSGVAVFAVRGMGDRGQSAAFAAEAETLRTAQEVHCARFGHYAPDKQTLVEAKLLSPGSGTLGGIEPASGACGPGTEPGKPSGYQITCTIGPNNDCSTAAQAGAVARGGTLVVASGAPQPILNPATNSSGAIHPQAEPMFNGLLAFSSGNEVVPDLAAALPTVVNNADGTQDATFTLRSGMTWHNGTPIVADDVKFTFEEALLKGHARTAASMGPALAGIDLPDGPSGLRVTFRFRYPYSPLLPQMNVTEAPIIPKNVYQQCADAGTLNATTATCPQNASPVGSGPFMFGERSASQIVLNRNPDYFKAGLPYLDKLVLVQATPAQVQTGLQARRGSSGSIDIGSPPGNTLGSFKSADYDTAQVPRGSGGSNCITTLAFNLWQKGQSPSAVLSDPGTYNHPILKNLAVRKAVYQAFDRQAAFTNIDFGQGRLADSPLHSKLAGAYTPQPGLPTFDAAAARQGLQSAGWVTPSGGDATTTRVSDGRAGLPSQGTPLAFDVIHFDSGAQLQYGAQLKANLRQVGIDVEQRPATNSVTQGRMGSRDYDTTFVSYCHGDDPVIGVRRQYHSTQINTAGFTNQAGFRERKGAPGDGSMDDLWDRGVQSSGQQYAQIYGQVQTKAVEQLPMVWMTETLTSRVSRSVCSGFNNQNTGLFAETASCSG